MSIISDLYFNPPERFMKTVKEKLKEGDVYKNSQYLCDQLEIQRVKSRSLKQHQAAWKSFFDFKKVDGKQEILILQIYDKPKPYIPEKQKQYYKPVDTDTREIYQPILRELILGLVPKKGYSFTISSANLFYETGFVNKEYLTLSDKIERSISKDKTTSNISNLILLQSWIRKIAYDGYIEKSLKKLIRLGYITSLERIILIKENENDNYRFPDEQEQEIIDSHLIRTKCILSNNKMFNISSFVYSYFVYNNMTKQLKEECNLYSILPFWKFEFNKDKSYNTLDANRKKELLKIINKDMVKKYNTYLINSISAQYDINKKRYEDDKELQRKYDHPYQLIAGKDKDQCLKDTKEYIRIYCEI